MSRQHRVARALRRLVAYIDECDDVVLAFVNDGQGDQKRASALNRRIKRLALLRRMCVRWGNYPRRGVLP